MLKRILLFALVGIIAVMVTLTMTKPERPAHYDAVKGLALKTVDHVIYTTNITLLFWKTTLFPSFFTIFEQKSA